MTVLVDLGAGPVGQAVALVLAQNPTPPADKGEEFGKASPIGLVVILVLGIATVLLVRSMTKHLRRVPASFDPPATDTPQSGGAAPDPGAPGSPAATASSSSSDAVTEGVVPRRDVDAAPDR